MTTSSTPPPPGDRSRRFDALYAAAEDPWGFSLDPYELGRYAAVLEHVGAGVFHRVFEPGCSIGVLTEMLGDRCRTVHATDVSPLAVQRARERCTRHAGVTIDVGTMRPPDGETFDLVVASEIGYYETLTELASIVASMRTAVRRGGRIIALHWLGHSDDHQLHGDTVQDCFAAVLDEWHLRHHRVERDARRVGFRLDVWDRP